MIYIILITFTLLCAWYHWPCATGIIKKGVEKITELVRQVFTNVVAWCNTHLHVEQADQYLHDINCCH